VQLEKKMQHVIGHVQAMSRRIGEPFEPFQTAASNLRGMWKVLCESSDVNVREKANLNSKVIGVKSKDARVTGCKEGDWLRLIGEPGYMLIKDQNGALVVQDTVALLDAAHPPATFQPTIQREPPPPEVAPPECHQDRLTRQVCPRGHELKHLYTPQHFSSCNICKALVHEGGELGGCRQCNWDMCGACFLKQDIRDDEGVGVRLDTSNASTSRVQGGYPALAQTARTPRRTKQNQDCYGRHTMAGHEMAVGRSVPVHDNTQGQARIRFRSQDEDQHLEPLEAPPERPTSWGTVAWRSSPSPVPRARLNERSSSAGRRSRH
jgi:hypothetical protein